MEWYFGYDGDDVVVPEDMKPVERLPSLNNWSDWDISEFSKKNYDGEDFCKELDISISRHQMACSNDSGMSYGLQNNLQQWGAPTHQQSDAQTDDIYMNSLLDEDLATENLYGSSSFSPHSHSNGLGDSNYFDNDDFSPRGDWNKEATNSFPFVEAPVLNDSVASEHDNLGVCMYDQSSVEESVLQELEMVTAKLNVKTRNCFRDSLYRLAENSRTNSSTQVRHGDIILEETSAETLNNDTYRGREIEATELKTNAIDRAIANLMFAKVDACVDEEAQAPAPAPASVSSKLHKLKCEADGWTENFHYSSNEPWATCFPMLIGDAEVPVVRK